jgi:hypothetical protein
LLPELLQLFVEGYVHLYEACLSQRLHSLLDYSVDVCFCLSDGSFSRQERPL